MAESVGLVLDPWQQLVVRVTLAERADGRYAASEVAELISRQNGKGAPLEAIVLHGMFLIGDPLTLWTAHQFKTSSEAFLRIRGWIDGSDSLRRRVAKINAAHGEEGIELTNGVRLRFLARSKSSGRGFSPQRIIWDEAQELSKVAFEAMRPSMRAQRNPQSIYAGTVPGPEINNPEHWTRIRDRGRSGLVSRLAWLEWSPAGSDDPLRSGSVDLDDPKVWAASNPGLGYRLTLETIASDREEMAPDSFAREALSIWPSLPVGGSGIFGAGRWEACRLADDLEDDTPPVKALGLAVSVGRDWASIGAAGRWSDNRFHVGAVDRRAGTDWVVDEAARIASAHDVPVVLDGKGPAADLAPALSEAGARVITVNTNEYLDACAGIFDAVAEERITHLGNPELDAAVAGSVWRMVGDRRAVGRAKSLSEVSMLEAVVLAYHGAINGAEPSVYFI